MSARDFKITALLLAVLAFLALPVLPAFAEEKTATERLGDIEKRLKDLEDGQKKILENQEKMFEDLKNLRVWVRRT
ncbi:MAG TPA: hypothetical protein VL688_05190 [Verrucomicrobiae bacterium]|nr:hypothetical protein [Verrucomicrobiae bacterium]